MVMLARHRFVILAGLFLVASSVAVAAEHTKDTLATVKKNVAAKKAVIVDVREKEEWDGGHIEDAMLVPLSALQGTKGLEASLKRLPKDRILYTHCAVGVRSLKAAEILKKHGYDVRALKAGYPELLNAGFPKANEK
jgi:rhodanese-related sulfurtransferase